MWESLNRIHSEWNLLIKHVFTNIEIVNICSVSDSMYKDHLLKFYQTKDTKLVLLINGDWPGELETSNFLTTSCAEPG